MKRVLVVDDEPNLRDMLMEFCEDIGVQPLPAENGTEALQKAAAEKPDAITVDMRMPDMTGLEVIAKLKADPALKEIPVFLLTADGKLHEAEALSRGAAGVVPKPVSRAALKGALEKVLGPIG